MSHKDQWKTGFAEGVMWAAAYLVQAHGADSLAEYLLQESGVDPHTSGDAYDQEILSKVIARLDQHHKV